MKLAPRYDGPAVISIAGHPDDVLVPVTRQRRRLEATLAGLAVDDWDAASRCEGWTVQDVVAHIVSVNTFWHASVSAGRAGTPTRMLHGFDPAATPPLLVDSMRALTATEVLEQFVASNDAFLGALAELDGPEWSTLAEAPAGHLPIRVLAHHALWDSWIHERDVALPLGLTPAVEADEVGATLRFVAALGPALVIDSESAPKGRFRVEAREPDTCFTLEVGDSVAVGEGLVPVDAPCLRGNAVELVEALSLRLPLPATTPIEWRHLLGGLASAFDAVDYS